MRRTADESTRPCICLRVRAGPDRPNPNECLKAAHAIERLRAGGPLLVCCALGYSRSATAVAAWLLNTGRAATVEQALTIIRTARADVVLHPAHRQALEGLPNAC